MLASPRQNTGFTLIEVLIALFVLAIGLLGMATLMMNSMQSSQGASQRSAATVSAYDLAERLRANRTQAAVANSPYAGNPAAAALPLCFTDLANTTGCNAADTAALDRAQWWANLQVNIPGAAATVQQVNTTTFCLVIFWQEPGVATTDSGPATPCGIAPNGRAYYTTQVTL